MRARYSGQVLLLVNGLVVDGSGSPGSPSSVLVDRDRIVEVGPVDAASGIQSIDCTGLVIAPGFIDLHSHSDLQVLDGRTEKLKQGVTTEVVGNCGFSPFPANDAKALREFGSGILGKTDDWGWPSAKNYLADLQAAGAADRTLPLVGHGSLRIAVHGLGLEPLTAVELDRLCGFLDDSLDAGCVGLSTGLMYAPGSGADSTELESLCRVVGRRDKLYTSHIRSYAETLVEAVEEQIGLAERTGCRLQISHLQAAGRANWHLQQPALEKIEAARQRGVDVEFDIYPYQCGSTVLTQFLPEWALDGGTPALLARIQDRPVRERLIDELNDMGSERWSDVTISSVNSQANQHLIGMTVTDIARNKVSDEGTCVVNLLAEEHAAVNIVSFNQSESNLRELITHDLCSVITDGFYVKGNPHPRLHGTYPELLGKMVRELAWLSLPSAVHKSTAQPATRLKLSSCGLVKSNYFADLVAFDPEQITTAASYTHPRSDPAGIAFVMKRGVIVLGDPVVGSAQAAGAGDKRKTNSADLAGSSESVVRGLLGRGSS